MFDNLISLASEPSTEGEFKSFLQEYHKVLTSKFDFKPLKLGKALHAAAEAMKQESWHHLKGSTDTDTDTDTDTSKTLCWMVVALYGSNDSPETAGPETFDSEREALLWLWKRIVLPGLAADIPEDQLVKHVEGQSTESLRSKMDHHFQSLRENQDFKGFYGVERVTERAFFEGKKADFHTETKRETSTSCYELTLANNAGWLLVEAESLATIYAAIKPVMDLVVSVYPEVRSKNNDRDDVYFLGEICYKSSLPGIIRKLCKERKLWWVGDDPQDAKKIVDELVGKGARIIRVEAQVPTNPLGMMDIVFAINPAEASRFMGEHVEPETYLDESLLKM